ncbi:MAG: RNA polymerase sigma factor [Chloroflexota bacterium]
MAGSTAATVLLLVRKVIQVMERGNPRRRATPPARQLRELADWVRRRLQSQADAQGVDPGRLAVDEIVDEAYAVALRHQSEHDGRAPSPRLLRDLARTVIGREVARLRTAGQREVSLDTPVVGALGLGAAQAEEDLTLADLLADPTAPLPEEVVEHDELEGYLDQAFTELPPAWREVFYLHAIDGLALPAVAGLMGVPVETIVHSLEQTREFLRHRLIAAYGEVA